MDGTARKESLPVVNLNEARYECVFGRGCDGICCQNGRPPVYPEEIQVLDLNLDRILPLLRPEARILVERGGYLSNRVKAGQRMLRVSGGWCVFFNQGCVLHKLGASEGDSYRYKPCMCALFPLAKDLRDQWYVRQWDYKNEEWDLFCLDPRASPVKAADALGQEIELARRLEERDRAAGERQSA
jgi:hypothetical protein